MSSAYGTTAAPRNIAPLSPLTYPHPPHPTNTNTNTAAAVNHEAGNTATITLHHLTLQTAPRTLVAFLHGEFEAELERGTTYPQEGAMDRRGFEQYYFGADVFVGIVQGGGGASRGHREEDVTGAAPPTRASTSSSAGSESAEDGVSVHLTADVSGRAWAECLIGAYYVKPNYPGRSSHICNAGFLITHRHRNRGYGKLLAQSFLHVAPKLGYKASVFNLVYANNTGSLRIWDGLGFQRVGLIPRAGRLRTKDGIGEEYIDAVVVYKSFEDE